VAADRRVVEAFRGAGGSGKPCLAQLHVSLADTGEAAVDNARTWWPQAVVPPALLTELARPEHFEEAAEAIGPGSIESAVVCATDAGPVVAAVDRFVGAGFGTVYLHQVGPDQSRLAAMAEAELLPHYTTW
jgi:hypothetical protein